MKPPPRSIRLLVLLTVPYIAAGAARGPSRPESSGPAPAASSSSKLAALRESPAAGSITGKVVDADGAAVAGVCVVLCDQSSGIPLSRETLRPFTDGFMEGRETMDLAYAVTDEYVRVPAGRYRLVSQSWRDAPHVEGILEVNGKLIELHGVAENVEVPSDSATGLVLRPLGTGILRIDEDAPNDDVLLVVSTAPPRADPILRFIGWGGKFMGRMIGGNRMPSGETTIYGLPEEKVYLTVFANDSSPGWGAAEATIRSGATSVVYVPIVAGWSNGHHDPPKRLLPLFDEVKSLLSEDTFSMPRFLQANGIRIEAGSDRWQRELEISRHLERQLELPTGTKTTAADFMAAVGYVELGRMVQRRQEQRKQRAKLKTIESPQHAEDGKPRYHEAFVALFKELGEHYPCFELKGIDWPAVGEEMLPRAKEVENNEQFGRLCMELVARLEDSHAHVGRGSQDPPVPPFPAWDPGFACLIDDRGKPVVYYVDRNGPAEAAGVRVGMTVVSLNGKPAQEAIEACMEQSSRYVGYSSRRYLRYQAARWFVRQMHKGDMVALEMQEPNGTTRTFELPATCPVRYLPRLPGPLPRPGRSSRRSAATTGSPKANRPPPPPADRQQVAPAAPPACGPPFRAWPWASAPGRLRAAGLRPSPTTTP